MIYLIAARKLILKSLTDEVAIATYGEEENSSMEKLMEFSNNNPGSFVEAMFSRLEAIHDAMRRSTC
jgi:hypothetical protein